MKTLKIASLIALCSMAFSANATVIWGTTSDSTTFGVYNSQSVSTGGGSAYSPASTRYDYMTLDRFDSSLGTLDSVTISFSGSWYHNSSGYEDDDSSWWGNDYVRMTGRAVASYGLQLYDPYQTTSSRADSDYLYCRDTDGYCSDREYSGTRGFSGSLNLAGFSLNQFIGNDALNLRAFNSQDADVTSCSTDGSDRCGAASWGNWSGQVTVTYNYFNQVPEPGMLTLFALGLLAVGISRRRQSVA